MKGQIALRAMELGRWPLIYSDYPKESKIYVDEIRGSWEPPPPEPPPASCLEHNE